MARPSPLRSFFARSNDDLVKIIGMAVLVALVSSAAVSVTSVMLKPYQDANRAAEQQARMDKMLDTLPGMRDLMMETGVDTLETRLVNLDDGSFSDAEDPAAFDLEAALQDPEASIALPADVDIAGIKRRANQSPIYLLQKDGDLKLIVLPVYGAGYQSTLRAALAIEADLVTIAALAIIEQGDTPGFGARIEEPEWLAQWPGKKIADETGTIRIELVRGEASTPYEVDGISGATYTSNGVTNLLHFWLGDMGFGPFLTRLRQEGL
ncbi:NADH:ubiquinone reductase (Na(+)-transporting) subunit C [Hoeflea ulvae]|uniref:Na(+)-translocating NADH-quinone reductase subunit C n=1 Tax=Hoeflea ulvae TaxID=2983764 RepID=A0ABT3YL99_9HYPH|nr:NADH:ubiquinone reductase (Na(+)-transporting) subunit C [Hoeflea ulvae]MCY0096670.1 NADH:ubiquinone reductase (Na(+)-transporting) subunit C [Hoeflea ulvae]